MTNAERPTQIITAIKDARGIIKAYVVHIPPHAHREASIQLVYSRSTRFDRYAEAYEAQEEQALGNI